MIDPELLREIEAVTEDDIANVEAELGEETRGMVVGEPITDPFFKKAATLYFMELWGIARRSKVSSKRLHGARVTALDRQVQEKLAEFYGAFVSEEEWASHEVFLWIRKGWRVHKVRHDIFNDPQEEKKPEHLN